MGDMFRFYVTEDDGTITDKTKLYSPYVQDYKPYSERPYQTMNKEHKAELKDYAGDLDAGISKNIKDRDSMTIIDGKGLQQHNPKRLGFSGIGIADPKYSFYTMSDVLGRFNNKYTHDANGNFKVMPPTKQDIEMFKDNADMSDFYDGLPYFVKKYVDNFIDGTGKYVAPDTLENYKMLFKTMPESIVKELMSGTFIDNKFMDKHFTNGVSRSLYEPTAFTSEGSKDKLYNLINMHEALRTVNNGLEAVDDNPVLTLVNVPEDKLVSTEDIGKYNLNSQRDYPEELIAKSVIPYRILSKGFINDLEDLWQTDKLDKYVQALNDSKVSDDVGLFSGLRDSLLDDYDHLFKKHGIVSDNILSDETKKYIYKDMSNDYNNLCKQKNIVNTLIDVSRF